MAAVRRAQTRRAATPTVEQRADQLAEAEQHRVFASAVAEANGLIAASVVELTSGATLQSQCLRPGFDVVVAGALSSAVLRHRLRVVRAFSPQARLDDMLVVIGAQLHLIRMWSPTSFLYLVADAAMTHFAALRSVASKYTGVGS
jgi:hypothetical protein